MCHSSLYHHQADVVHHGLYYGLYHQLATQRTAETAVGDTEFVQGSMRAHLYRVSAWYVFRGELPV
jgi:hypothetical protein